MMNRKGKRILALCLTLTLASGPVATGTAAEIASEEAAAQNVSAVPAEGAVSEGDVLPEESETVTEGESVPEGSGTAEDESAPKGSVTSSEGESVPEGSVTSPEGESVPEGSVTPPEGESVPEGSVTSPEGESVPEGSVTPPEGESVPEGSVTSPEGESVPEGSMTSPEGESVPEGEPAPEGSMTASEDGGTMPVMAPNAGLEIDLSVYENGPKEPLPPPDEGIAPMAGDEPDYAETRAVSGAKFNDPSTEIAASVEEFEINIESNADTVFASADWKYAASIPQVLSFFDYQGRYNVVYQDSSLSSLVIQRYNTRMNLNDTLRIAKRYPLFGTVVTDEAGHYYVVWGQNDMHNQNIVTVCVTKYDYNGNVVGECALKGYDTDNYSSSAWGTAQPFQSGNCRAVVNKGFLACNFSRQMYNGHQSNYVFFVDCSNMQRTRTTGTVPYSSHSFDQRIIPLSGSDWGDYLTANQGDAYPRSFRLSVVKMQDYSQVYDIDHFHFREGADRSYGYNETYAQMGGIGETRNAYVFCGSSERTLSLATAPTGGAYCGHSEARDLFVQFLKKDFYNYQGSEQYVTRENVRYAEGQKPAAPGTELFLNGNERDYGVIWLTEYEDDYYVNNPKMIITDDNRVVVMWEKLSYATHTGTSYYAILNEDGSVYRHPLEIIGARLAGNVEPVYRDGRIYWTTSDETGAHVYSLDLSRTEVIDHYEGLRKVGDKWIFVRRGKKDSSVNGLVPYEGQWFYLRNGEVDTSVRGFVDYDGKKFYVTEGRVCSDYSGLVQDPASRKWYFISEGQFQDQYSGLALYDGSWFLLSAGVLNDSYNGLYHYDGRDFLMANGQIRTDYSGLFEYDGSWYFLVNGQVSDYTGLVLYDEHWFYVRKGILASYYTGNVTYDGKTFYVSNGQIY